MLKTETNFSINDLALSDLSTERFSLSIIPSKSSGKSKAIFTSSLGGISGEKAIARVTLSDGSYPPFGSAVYRSNGNEQEVAIVAEEGLTYLTGLIKNAEYIIKWNGSQSCQIKINSLDTTTLNNLTCY